MPFLLWWAKKRRAKILPRVTTLLFSEVYKHLRYFGTVDLTKLPLPVR